MFVASGCLKGGSGPKSRSLHRLEPCEFFLPPRPSPPCSHLDCLTSDPATPPPRCSLVIMYLYLAGRQCTRLLCAASALSSLLTYTDLHTPALCLSTVCSLRSAGPLFFFKVKDAPYPVSKQCCVAFAVVPGCCTWSVLGLSAVLWLANHPSNVHSKGCRPSSSLL